MAEYSSAYTQNTTDITVGTEIYKCSRVVSTVNPDTLDNSCIYCGSDAPIKTDYFPCYSVNSAERSELDSKWDIASNEFNFTNSVTEKPFNICFVRCNYSGTSSLAGLNSVYQIGKTIYNETQSNASSNMSVLNPFDIRKILFFPQFDGYLGTSYSAVNNKDLKYVMDNKDNFFITQMTMTCFVWNGTSYTSVSTFQVRPCIVGDDYFLPINVRENIHNFSTTNYNTSKAYNQAFYGARDESNMPISHIAIPTDKKFPFTTEPTETNSVADGLKFHASYNWYTSDFFIFSNADQILKMLAYCGCYFVDSSYNTSGKTLNTFWNDEHIYLGEMKEGAITTGVFIKGTDILTSDTINKGEYSSQTDFDPSGGGGDTDQDSDWDDVPINGGGIGGGSAFCRFYYCTEAELANLRTWTMGLSSGGDPIPAGFDPKSNIIGLTVFPFTVSGNGPTTIKFTTNGGIDPITTQEMPRVVDSGVACEGGAGATTRILNTTIDVPATMKSRGEPWLDYESYIELYIPMCGVYQVDPQAVIGRTIHVNVFLDPVSGTVMGIAWVVKDGGKCIIAQGSGTPGVQIPVAVGNYGLSQAARVQNTLGGFGNTATSAISTQMVSNTFQARPGERGLNGVRSITQPNNTAGNRIAAFNRNGAGAGGIAGSVLGFTGLLSSVQHWVSSRQIANSPGTSVSGGFSGSMAEWCGVFTPYVKIVRPKFRKPDNYKHTCGEPEVTARTLNTAGYAVCINPDISGLTNATEAERAAIYQLLSTGVYYK